MKIKLLKYSSLLVVILCTVLLLSYIVVLHTQRGARWVVEYLTSDQNSLIKINSVEGTLADKIKLSGIEYKDNDVLITANQLNYEINDINWLDLGLDIELISLDSVHVKLLNSNQDISEKTGFKGLKLPFQFNVNNFDLNELIIYSDNKQQKFEQINIKVKAENQTIEIMSLSSKYEDVVFSMDGKLKLTSSLPFEIKPNWKMANSGVELSGSGNIAGNINTITIDQELTLNHKNISGVFALSSNINLSKESPVINLAITSNNSKINDPSFQEVQLSSLKLNLNGTLQRYNIEGSVVGKIEKYPATTISLNGNGNFNSLTLDQLRISNAMALIEAPTRLLFDKEINIDSVVNIKQLDPQLIYSEWPGKIDGKLNMHISLDANNQFSMLINDANITGLIKQYDFNLNGSSKIFDNTIQIDNSQISMGDNKINFNALISQDKIDGEFIAQFSDLNQIESSLKGSIESEIKFSGNLQRPKFSGFVTGSDVLVDDIFIKNINLTGSGLPNATFNIKAESNGITYKDLSFEEVNINSVGTLSDHKIDINVVGSDYTSFVSAKGQLNTDKSWTGEVQNQEFKRLDIDSQWLLNKPINLSIGTKITVTNGCWSNNNSKGSICVDFKSGNDFNDLKINLDVDKLELVAFKAFMPKDLLISGTLNGQLNLDVLSGNISSDSFLELSEGKLNYAKGTANEFISGITKAQIKTSQINQALQISSEFELDDGTKLIIKSVLDKDKNNNYYVNGSVNGQFFNTRYLVALIDEIKDIKGEFIIDGQFSGPLNNPEISLIAAQKQGYLILETTGSKIEKLEIKLKNETIKSNENQKMLFEISGVNTGGYIKSDGYISLDANSNWQLIGSATGENFRLLTKPEIELNISPKLKFKANKNTLMLTGDINIPYGKVKIQSLPESAITTSEDVKIHQPQSDELDSVYDIKFNVNAVLENPLQFEALGLKTNVEGQLRVNNIENKAIDAAGTLYLKKGSYEIYGQKLDISKGELIFNGPISNPELDVNAFRKSIDGEVVAGVELGGTINQLQSSLYSDPKLSDLETLSYILTGRGLKQDSGTQSEQLIQAAIVLGLKASSPIFTQIQSKFGIDVFNIQSGASSSESIVEAGKHINDDIYLGYRHSLFNREGILVLEYQINKMLKLETTEGKSQSADLIYSRRKK